MLKKQLIKINGRMQYFERAKKNGKELENLLQDAQRRVEMADGFKYEGLKEIDGRNLMRSIKKNSVPDKRTINGGDIILYFFA